MLRLKTQGLKLDTAFLKDSGDLAALLQVADPDDLDALVDYITDNGNGRVALAKDVRERFITCKNARNYRAADRGAMASEILSFGGNSVANLFRGGKGVPYSELAGDVAGHLKVTFAKGADARTIEEAIIAKLYDDAVQKLSSDERRSFTATMGALAATRAATAAAAGAGMYAMSTVVASAMASTVIGRGLPLAISIIASRGTSALLGPFGVALSGIWTVTELAGAAYRVTVPCVVQIAHIRQSAFRRALECRCSKCTGINTRDAKFCSECGNPMPQEPAPSTGLATASF